MLTAQIMINGILLGGLYACLAMGFSLVWGVMNLINLAHGSMIILGAYITYLLYTHLGIDPFLTLPVSGVALFALGYVLQRALINRVVTLSVFLSLIFTFGLDMILINVNLALFTADVRAVTPTYASATLEIGGLRVPYTRLAVFVIALATTVVLALFVKYTRTGQAIRATAQNPRAALAVGIDTKPIYALTFGIGAAIAGIAGSLVSVVYTFSPVTGALFTMKSFVIVVLGGLGSIHGAIVAGIILGVAENFVVGVINPGYRDVISFVLLVLILILRPHGLFGQATDVQETLVADNAGRRQ